MIACFSNFWPQESQLLSRGLAMGGDSRRKFMTTVITKWIDEGRLSIQKLLSHVDYLDRSVPHLQVSADSCRGLCEAWKMFDQ